MGKQDLKYITMLKFYFFYYVPFIALIACDSGQNQNASNMDNPTMKDKKKSNLKLTIDVQDSVIYSDDSFYIEMQLKNVSTEKLMLNKRLSIGYEKSISRELYFKIIDSYTQEIVGRPIEDYDRPPSYFDEYGYLLPLETISKSLDLSEWYEIKLPKGEHKLTLLGFYQADEDYFDKRPENVINGIFQSDPITILWVQK